MFEPITPTFSDEAGNPIGGGIDATVGDESQGPKGDPGGGPRGEVVAE